MSDQPTSSRYRRIAPVYDLLDWPFEHFRYRVLRRMLFAGLAGNILDAGVGTGRNMDYYPPGATVTGIDVSPAMLERARHRRDRLHLDTPLIERDIRDTGLPGHSFDAIVASFLFCVLPQEQQHAALGELARLLKPSGELRLLEYTRPSKGVRRAVTHLWEPWMKWAYGAGYDRNTEAALPHTGFAIIESRFVVDELIKYIRATPVEPTRQ